MRLPEESLTVDQQIDEFDYWLTSKQVAYSTTNKYKQEMKDAISILKILSNFLTQNNKKSLDVDDIIQFISEYSQSLITDNKLNEDIKSVTEHIQKVFDLLFLVTASSDNNLKSQFSVYLRTSDVGVEYDKFSFRRNKKPESVSAIFSNSPISAKSLANILARYIVAVSSSKNPPSLDSSIAWSIRYYQLIKAYLGLIFEESGTEQLYYLCAAYRYVTSLNPEENDIDFGEFILKSTIVYKIRGSVTASDGHKNEDLLRERLKLLGLQPDIDFNLKDVVIERNSLPNEIAKDLPKPKDRAFDFVLPYRVENWGDAKTKIYMQAQFYAGDSGSVSHKVIDQTVNSRKALKSIKGDKHRFVEYLDGAGYGSALRGDLKKILEMEDTASFMQIKSILVRLRREMQIIDYANPTDIAQAVYLAGEKNTPSTVKRIMQNEFDFSEGETNRVLDLALEQGQIISDNGNLTIAESELKKAARWTFILDYVVLEGKTLTKEQREDSRYFIVPGYGRAYGALGSTIQDKITEISNELSTQFVRDTESLVELGVLKHGGKYA